MPFFLKWNLNWTKSWWPSTPEKAIEKKRNMETARYKTQESTSNLNQWSSLQYFCLNFLYSRKLCPRSPLPKWSVRNKYLPRPSENTYCLFSHRPLEVIETNWAVLCGRFVAAQSNLALAMKMLALPCFLAFFSAFFGDLALQVQLD